MNIRTIFGIALIPLVLGVPALSHADDDTGLYVSVSLNRLSADFEDINDVKFGESDTTVGVNVGYMFNDVFGIEGGYLDLGDYQSTGNRPGNQIDIDADAYSLAAVFNWSVADEVDLYAKLGAYHLDANSDSTIAGARINENSDETEAFGALGAEYDFGNLNVFVEISKVDTDISKLTIDVATLGVKYEFGG